LLGGCAGTASEAQRVYVVRPQDTLYSIAWRFSLDYRELARWNHIGPDFRITVGQRLLLSSTGATSPPGQGPRIKPAPQPLPQRTPQPLPQPVPLSGPQSVPPPPAQSAHGESGAAGFPSTLKWVWPTERLSAPLPVPGGGILLAGQLGQDIRAACAGRVVYSGSGLRSYGNLIIIKHSENLLSAYAHNRDLLVRDGQEVREGELIAHMGEGAPQKPVLYFEIRRNGKPIDPTPILPKVK